MPPASVSSHLTGLAPTLLAWFAARKRDLPWRDVKDPYAIWVSEIMLQQTRVAAVVPYYLRWMERFPTLEILAAASVDDVLHAWQGLGYYSRARRLLDGARAVVERHGGRVPARYEALLELPGVGRYTAGAIASVAFGACVPVVDGNVIRVLTRLFALRGDPAREPLRSRLWELAAGLVPAREPGDFNVALMELGATVCSRQSPACGECPVREYCQARARGIVEELPETASPPAITPIRMAAALLSRGDQMLLARRPDTAERWAGLWQFPAVELQQHEEASTGAERALREWVGLVAEDAVQVATVRHAVTRYRITLEVYRCRDLGGVPTALACSHWAWCSPPDLGRYALPAAHRKIARLVSAVEG